MPEEETRYTVDELMVTAMSKQLKNEDFVQLGAGAPLATVAILFARANHAPDLTTFIYGAINPEVMSASDVVQDPIKLYGSACGFMPHEEMNYLIENHRPDLQFIRPLQIDPCGSINVSIIGDPKRPKMRFFSIALADVVNLTKRIVLYSPEHSKRVFVKKLDFLSGAGHLEEGRWRKRMGIRAAGPDKVITNLCVMGFDEVTKRMRLESVHPGITVEQVQENTGFEILVPPTLPTTQPPTKQELELLREKIDPYDTRKLDFKELREKALAGLSRKDSSL